MLVIRIRMKGPDGVDDSAAAWKRNRVGIWYGAWSVRDLPSALAANDPNILEQSAGHPKLIADPSNDWKSGHLAGTYFKTIRRFAELPDGTWVLVVFDQALHLAQLSGPIKDSDPDDPLNQGGEVFHYREIDPRTKKSFPLVELPEVYRTIPSFGRGNVHRYDDKSIRQLLKLLIDSQDAGEVRGRIEALPLRDWLEALGPRSWEQICLAYLIITRAFVPTQSVGGNVEAFDLVGRNRGTGAYLYAQCKKDPKPQEVDPGFAGAIVPLLKPHDVEIEILYFAYGGVVGEVPDGVTVIDRSHMTEWLEQDPAGQKYFAMLREVPRAGGGQ